MKINIDKIGFIVILTIVVLSNIFIGTNIVEPVWFLQSFITIFTAIYMVIKKNHKQKNIIIKNKIDIIVLFFITSTFLPFAFKNYISLDGTVDAILKYFSVYGFYILVRNIINNNKRKKILFNTFLLSSFIPIIFGYDILLFNYKLNKIYQIIKTPQLDTSDRMISTFTYANTFAVYLSVMCLFAFISAKNTNIKKFKILYYLYILIILITIVLTQSKAVIAIDVVVFLTYTIYNIKNHKISKKWLIVGIVLIIAFALYYFIAVQYDKPLINDNTIESNKVIREIEPNKEYEFEFNITSKTEFKFDEFEIDIVEVSRYLTEDIIYTWKFSDFDGVKTISFKTSDTVDHIIVRITNKYKNKISINELKINGEKYIIKYKYIPEQIVRIFMTFNSRNSSVWQRGDYYKDSLKIITNYSGFIGSGGSAWKSYYGLVQDYLYYSKECHSYIFDVAISFGAFGLVTYFILISLVCIEIKKIHINKDYEKVVLTVAFLIMFLHSLMDFDFSIFIMQIVFFMIIALIIDDERDIKESKCSQIIDILMIIAFVMVSIFNMLGTIANIVENNKKQSYAECHNIAPWISYYHYNKISYNYRNHIYNEENIADIKNYIEKEPFMYQNELYKIYIKNLPETFCATDIKYLIDIWEKYPNKYRYNIDMIIDRANIMLELAEKAKKMEYHELSNNIYQIIVKEADENLDRFVEYKKTEETKTMISFKYESYISNVEKAMNILKQE